ncbi:hypothetical protein BC332_27254 [Capsicum chinense]|nr:hypothetical protein BC332_27254 [Capsicum chinense]
MGRERKEAGAIKHFVSDRFYPSKKSRLKRGTEALISAGYSFVVVCTSCLELSDQFWQMEQAHSLMDRTCTRFWIKSFNPTKKTYGGTKEYTTGGSEVSINSCWKIVAEKMPGIWMLAKSEDVSCQFQMLATAVAVVLDVILPLEEMDVSVEVKQVAGGVSSTQINGGSSSNADRVIEFLNLDDFRCPITLEIMSDPVTIASGHTNDQSSILKWFRAGNSTCPKTGERLTSIDLVPNLALKFLIKQYCYVKGISFVETGRRNRDTVKSVATGSVANEQATKSCLVEAGAIPPLLNLVTWTDSSCQENAMAAQLNLSKNSNSKSIIVGNGGLFVILDVLKGGLKMEARQHAAGTLFYRTSVEEYPKMIGENPEFIPSLLELLIEDQFINVW